MTVVWPPLWIGPSLFLARQPSIAYRIFIDYHAKYPSIYRTSTTFVPHFTTVLTTIVNGALVTVNDVKVSFYDRSLSLNLTCNNTSFNGSFVTATTCSFCCSLTNQTNTLVLNDDNIYALSTCLLLTLPNSTPNIRYLLINSVAYYQLKCVMSSFMLPLNRKKVKFNTKDSIYKLNLIWPKKKLLSFWPRQKCHWYIRWSHNWLMSSSFRRHWLLVLNNFFVFFSRDQTLFQTEKSYKHPGCSFIFLAV